MSKKWSYQDTEILIKSYFTDGLPLWNGYIGSQNANTRMEAWKKVAAKMKSRGFDEPEVRRKMNYISNRYKTELDKLESNPSYQTRTKWFHLVDSFRRPHLSKRENLRRPASWVKAPTKRKPTEVVAKVKTGGLQETSSSEQYDRLDLFGKCVAAQMRVFPKKVAMEVQLQIHTLLTNQQIVVENEDGNNLF